MGREAFEHETEIEIDVVEALEHDTDIEVDVIVASYSTVYDEDRNSENDNSNKEDGEEFSLLDDIFLS